MANIVMYLIDSMYNVVSKFTFSFDTEINIEIRVI